MREIELDIPRWRVLMLLEGTRARSVSYLSTEAIVKLSTMTRIVQRMEADGLVETRPRASDARVTEALLTGHGRRARVLALQRADLIFEKAFKAFSDADVRNFNQMLSLVHENLARSGES